MLPLVDDVEGLWGQLEEPRFGGGVSVNPTIQTKVKAMEASKDVATRHLTDRQEVSLAVAFAVHVGHPVTSCLRVVAATKAHVREAQAVDTDCGEVL